MKSGTLFAILFIIALGIGTFLFQNFLLTGNAVGDNTTPCESNWTCGDWSNCISGEKIRNCFDLNNCESSTPQLPTRITCELNCTPRWECSDWTPEECPEEKIQTRNCIDENGCETTGSSPEEVKDCSTEEEYSWLFYVIITIIVLLAIALMVGLYYKVNNPKRRIISERKITQNQVTPYAQKPKKLPTTQEAQPNILEKMQPQKTTQQRTTQQRTPQQNRQKRNQRNIQAQKKRTTQQKRNELMPKNNSPENFRGNQRKPKL